jgi:REP element-mobilizing transposase RayT
MNRGLARRTVFETDRDVRAFLAGLARAVRSGRLEVNAYCLLTTHYHLLVRSPRGELAEAMRRIQNDYVRWFNRARRRDGPLFRGRYRSRLVETWSYRQILVRYIDSNPVNAGLVPDARMYPHGSAQRYGHERGPLWLARDWVESFVRAACGASTYRPQDYPRVFGGLLSPRVQRLVERRLEARQVGEDPLDELLEAAPRDVLAWMRRKAALADGTGVGLPVADPEDVADVLARVGREQASIQAQLALLRELCALTFAEAGARVGVTESAAWKLYSRHRQRLEADAGYAERVATLATQVLAESTESGTFLSTAD